MRSMRLSLAEIFKIDQKPISKRLLTTLPLIIGTTGHFGVVANQRGIFQQPLELLCVGQPSARGVYAACGVGLAVQAFENGFVALLPGMFMAFIVLTYILWISPEHGGPVGFGLDLAYAYGLGGALTIVLSVWAYKRGKRAELLSADANTLPNEEAEG